MKSLVIKRSVIIDGRKTSVSLEEAFWKSLREIADGRRQTLSYLVSGINAIGKLRIFRPPFVYLFLNTIRVVLLSKAKRFSSGKFLFSRPSLRRANQHCARLASVAVTAGLEAILVMAS